MAGRKRKPDALKQLAGTAQPCRMNPDAPTASEGEAEAPEWLSERGAEIFDQLTAIIAGMGIASPDDTAMLSMLASRLEEVEVCTAVIEDLGRVYTSETKSGTMVRGRPEVAMRSEAMRHAQSLLSEFGLSPAARSKVSAVTPPESNPFNDL
ncbi:phage terminase small subunit P27 family [Methylorubrum sp. Q1]|uniref:phage terminase small subunit P27 family n=1 Tax=Methylorubrum sp. Q1 TaxID=2562453 RepID=UPI0010768E43|nr:phage terminase small subunit P27 family [Methylorubrum sp. Q1]TFZ59328.1 phage terminase small subunit P27 family [Methylorubrum sp. Q1]